METPFANLHKTFAFDKLEKTTKMFSLNIRCPDGDKNLTYRVIQVERSAIFEVI